MKNDDLVAAILGSEPCAVPVLLTCPGTKGPRAYAVSLPTHFSGTTHICLLENDQIYFKRTALLLGCTLPLAAWTLKSWHCEHMVGEHGSSVGKQKFQLQCIDDASTLPTSHSTLK